MPNAHQRLIQIAKRKNLPPKIIARIEERYKKGLETYGVELNEDSILQCGEKPDTQNIQWEILDELIDALAYSCLWRQISQNPTPNDKLQLRSIIASQIHTLKLLAESLE